jgi:hypothetical protein
VFLICLFVCFIRSTIIHTDPEVQPFRCEVVGNKVVYSSQFLLRRKPPLCMCRPYKHEPSFPLVSQAAICQSNENGAVMFTFSSVYRPLSQFHFMFAYVICSHRLSMSRMWQQELNSSETHKKAELVLFTNGRLGNRPP